MLRIELVTVGRTREAYLAEGIAEYGKRLGRYSQFQFIEVKERRGVTDPPQRLREEGEMLLAACGKGSWKILLAPEGAMVDSRELASLLSAWETKAAKGISFIIGGPDGVGEEVRRAADQCLSLSRMTFTHEMARLILLEQIYRAFSIRSGSRYHR